MAWYKFQWVWLHAHCFVTHTLRSLLSSIEHFHKTYLFIPLGPDKGQILWTGRRSLQSGHSLIFWGGDFVSKILKFDYLLPLPDIFPQVFFNDVFTTYLRPSCMRRLSQFYSSTNVFYWRIHGLFLYAWAVSRKLTQVPPPYLSKTPKFETKNDFFWYFWARHLKNLCHIWNQHFQICLIPKFHEKLKLPKSATENTLFGYFWPWILKNYCNIWSQQTQICLITKFSEKTKLPKFGTRNALFGYFWDTILKS